MAHGTCSHLPLARAPTTRPRADRPQRPYEKLLRSVQAAQIDMLSLLQLLRCQRMHASPFTAREIHQVDPRLAAGAGQVSQPAADGLRGPADVQHDHRVAAATARVEDRLAHHAGGRTLLKPAMQLQLHLVQLTAPSREALGHHVLLAAAEPRQLTT